MEIGQNIRFPYDFFPGGAMTYDFSATYDFFSIFPAHRLGGPANP
jgi:hypothetical protein